MPSPPRSAPRERETLILWTIRQEKELRLLEQRGRLRSDGRRVPDYRREAYAWMGARLAEQVPRPRGCHYPLWAWAQYAGSSRPRPDLRARGHCPPGTRAVLLELELPRKHVLLSDFQKWHAVLNRRYLADTERQHGTFERALRRAGVPETWPYPEPFASQLIGSWNRVFDLSGKDTAYWGPLNQREIQAVFWELRAEHVRGITGFRAR